MSSDDDLEKLATRFSPLAYIRWVASQIGIYRVCSVIIGSLLVGFQFGWMAGVAAMFLAFGIIDPV
jgi:hypothetical protein